jgi:putative ABC transport system substrate-binding protein
VLVHRIGFAVALTFCLIVMPLTSSAQTAGTSARIGYLGFNLTGGGDPRIRTSFLQGLRDLGYVEGGNIQIVYRDAQGNTERFPALAAELAALKVDVIVTFGGTLGALAAKRATSTIPIVFGAAGNPVGEGIVASLARPGGNVTGLSVVSIELGSKALELIKQAVPGVSRVALLEKPDAVPERAQKDRLAAAAATAKALGIQLQVVEARGPQDFDRAFSDMTRARAGALAVLATPVFDSARQRLVELAAKHRLPTVYSYQTYVDAGGLMSYGPDLPDAARRAATYVDKILRGAKPSELPVEQPTKFDLVINLKTAKALGLTIPQTLLLRADQVIE